MPAEKAMGSSNRSGFSFDKKKGGSRSAAIAEKERGFDLKKALKGVSGGEEEVLESACQTRGDGRFDNGTNFMKQGNRVVIGPGAFSEENAEETLAELDRMGAFGQGSGPKPPPQPVAVAPSLAARPAPSGGKRGARPTPAAAADAGSLSAEMARLMDAERNRPVTAGHEVLAEIDTGDDFMDMSTSRSAFSLGSALPEYIMEEYPPDARYSTRRVEVIIHLPLLDSAKDVELDIGAHEIKLRCSNKYRLKAALPFVVDETRGRAKWLKAKKSLKVTVPAPKEEEPEDPSLSDEEDMEEIAKEIASNPFVKEKGRGAYV